MHLSDQPEQDPEYRGRKWEADLEHWRVSADWEIRQQVGMFRSVVDFALVALKGVVLVNGAATLAILAFVGSIWTGKAEEGQKIATQLTPALEFFVWGAGFGVLAAGLAYLTQVAFLELPRGNDANGLNWALIVGIPLRVGAVAVTITGIIMFGMGAQRAFNVFTGA